VARGEGRSLASSDGDGKLRKRPAISTIRDRGLVWELFGKKEAMVVTFFKARGKRSGECWIGAA